MKHMERLLDNYTAKGTTIESFKEELSNMAKATKVVKQNLSDMEILSAIDSDSASLRVARLKPSNIWSSAHALSMSRLPRKKFTDLGGQDLVDEYENKTKTLFYKDGSIYFTSSSLPMTLSQRTGVAGPAMMEPSLERDILVASKMNTDSTSSLIVRSENGINKIFAALSDKYKYVPQTFLNDVLDAIISDGSLGDAKCYNWMVDHHIGEIYIEFPDKAEELSALYDLDDKFIPGLYLAKSDVGECSIVVRSTWRLGSSVCIGTEVKRKHVGKFAIEKLLDEVKTKIFDKYTEMPARLCELMTEDITDPALKAKLTAKKFEKKNTDNISRVFRSILKQVNMTKATAKKYEIAILEQLMAEINPSQLYTAYDLCMMIMSIPSRIEGLPKAYENDLAIACGQAPYKEYDLKKASKSADEADIVLTA